MKILFLSQRFLYPMDTGGKIRTGKLLEKLSKRHHVVVVGNFEQEVDGPFEDDMRSLCAEYHPVAWREPPRGSMRFFARLMRNSLSRYPVTALNDFSPTLENAVLQALDKQEFDLAICDFVQSGLLFRRVRDIPRLLFQHNVEARIFERHVKNAGNPLARAFWSLQHARMARFEGDMVRDFDMVIAVSEKDAEDFKREYQAEHVESIPTGVDLDFYRAGATAAKTSAEIVFCGSMDWLPNEDGIKFFLDEIGPRLSEHVPDWHLTVVGRNPSDALVRAAERSTQVSLTGWVDDVRPYLEAAAVCIVPLRIGGGTRMKIYEAMAMSKAVVATNIGAEGLEVEDGADIRLVDDPKRFADAVADLVLDAQKRDAMGSKARALVEERFGWDRVADVFGSICEQTVHRYRHGRATADAGTTSA